MPTQEAKINRRVAARVIEARESARLEKQDLAEVLQITPQGYSPYEKGTRPFTVAQVFALAQALGRPVEWFLDLGGDLTPDESEALWLYRLIADKPMALRYLRMMAHVPEHLVDGPVQGQ